MDSLGSQREFPSSKSNQHKQNEENYTQIKGSLTPEYSQILSPAAFKFLERLHKKFNPARLELLKRRGRIQAEIDSGKFPDFLQETYSIRNQDWVAASIPADLMNRKVEITGPVDRKMMIHALNSGAQVFMADFEDSHSPTWRGTLEGQLNLRDAINKTLTFKSPERTLSLSEKTAVLIVRPRGWHLVEKNVTMGGEPISASLFDFGLHFFHNAKELIKRGTGAYFYLPKLENHLEARLWNDVFVFAQNELGIPKGTIRATVLIETILGAFEMDEIIFELQDHIAGLNCGRWDYIFSWIKKFRNHPNFLLPDRSQVTMLAPFLNSYCQLLIKTCHRRRIHAMGGMAAQIPIKNDPAANAAAIEKVKQDKDREVRLGFDGTWVAHPGLIEIARNSFDQVMKSSHQIFQRKNEWNISAADLLRASEGSVTEAGLGTNIYVSLCYLESWLRGLGCVPIHHLMEDAATVEISRAQIWQWLRHGKISMRDFENALNNQVQQIKNETGQDKFNSGKYGEALEVFKNVITNEEFVEFITLPAYEYL